MAPRMAIAVDQFGTRSSRCGRENPTSVSAVIPTFNCARLLRHALASALAQTVPLREIIVVDDGSTDDTAEVVASLGPAVTYVRQPNSGPSAARNRGAHMASGSWLAFLDADDQWMPDKIRRQLAAAHASPDAVLVYTATSLVYADGTRRLREAVPPAQLWPLLRYRNCLTDSTVLVRRNVFLEHGGFNSDLRTCEDWDLWARIRAHHSVTYVPDALCAYSIRPGSLSSNIDQMLVDTAAILEPTLLVGLTGIPRRLWRRRIVAAQLFGAALTALEAGQASRARRLLCRSAATWPAPHFMPERWRELVAVLLGPQRYRRVADSVKRLIATSTSFTT
jgi:GT2 family glycosyltransferase